MGLNLDKLTQQTIFLESFFNDIENDKIYYDEDDESIMIEQDSETYNELLENLTDLTLSIHSMVGKAIKKSMLSTIIKYYNEFAGTNYTDICVRYIN